MPNKSQFLIVGFQLVIKKIGRNKMTVKSITFPVIDLSQCKHYTVHLY